MYKVEHTSDDGTKVTVEFEAEHIMDIVENMKAFLLAVSFQPSTVSQAFGEE